MFAAISHYFNQLQGKFTYRQKFVFLAILFLSSIPSPTYWNIQYANFVQSRARTQTTGIAYGHYYSSLIYDAATHWILFKMTKQYETSEKRLASIEENVGLVLDHLNGLSKQSRETVEHHFVVGEMPTDAYLPLLDPLKHKWEDIVGNRQALHSSTSLAPYQTFIKSVAEQLHKAENLSSLTATDNPGLYYLVQANFYLYPLLSLRVLDVIAASNQGEVDQVQLATALYELHYYTLQYRKILEAAYKSTNSSSSNADSPLTREAIRAYESAVHSLKDFYQLVGDAKESKRAFSKEFRHRVSLTGFNVLNDLYKSVRSSNHEIGFLVEKGSAFGSHLKLIVYSLLSISSLIVIFYLVFHVLSGHLLKLTSYIENITNGVFDDHVLNPKDVVGQIGLSFLQMGKSIQRVVIQLQDVGSQLREFTLKIAFMADDQESAIVEQESNLQTLENITRDIATHSRNLANIMDALIASSEQTLIDNKSSQGLVDMQQTMWTLSQTSATILNTLSIVNEKVLKARTLISFMTNVSDQAQLLSLNAAIETDTMEKQQKTFADITKQVQRFADNSSVSTREIQQIVSEMFIKLRQGRDTTKSCIKEINSGANRLIQVSTQLSSIAIEGKKQTEKFGSVNAVMKEQAETAENIISSIQEISTAARDNTLSIRLLRQTISMLSDTTQELHKVLHLFFTNHQPLPNDKE